jgi:hypothetical protein
MPLATSGGLRSLTMCYIEPYKAARVRRPIERAILWPERQLATPFRKFVRPGRVHAHGPRATFP